MPKSPKQDFKRDILLRYAEEFRPATFYNANVRKTSQQIMLDLRPMAEYSVNEIAEFMIDKGYSYDFDCYQPSWLMYQVPKLE